MDPREIAGNLIRNEEGLRLKPYRCPEGRLSIGYGRNLDDCGISTEEAEILLQNDLEWCSRQIARVFPHWSETLCPARYAVILDMVYNLGLAGFRSFTRLVRAIGEENWDWAALELKNSRWADQVGARAVKLAEIMRRGTL